MEEKKIDYGNEYFVNYKDLYDSSKISETYTNKEIKYKSSKRRKTKINTKLLASITALIATISIAFNGLARNIKVTLNQIDIYNDKVIFDFDLDYSGSKDLVIRINNDQLILEQKVVNKNVVGEFSGLSSGTTYTIEVIEIDNEKEIVVYQYQFITEEK